MAIVNCRECQKPVSTGASRCPHCGVLVKRFSVTRMIWLGIIVVIVAAVVEYLQRMAGS